MYMSQKYKKGEGLTDFENPKRMFCTHISWSVPLLYVFLVDYCYKKQQTSLTHEKLRLVRCRHDGICSRIKLTVHTEKFKFN